MSLYSISKGINLNFGQISEDLSVNRPSNISNPENFLVEVVSFMENII